MKLLVIRNKETGKLLTISGDDVFWADHEAICWPESFRDTVENALKPGDEIVSLREEPTEPCEWCETYGGEMIAPSDDLYAFECALDAEDWSFCPNCGRSLQND